MNKLCHIDYLIVGAGPAGIQLAYHLDRAGKNYLVVEKLTTDKPYYFRVEAIGTAGVGPMSDSATAKAA